MSTIRLQSAMEYLMTYGWAILILGVVLAALYATGLLSPSTLVQNTCSFQAPFACLYSSLSISGVLTINVEQSSASPINVTAIGCNSNGTVTNMQSISPANAIPISGNLTFTVSCYGTGNKVFTGQPGTVYHGYFLLNYTNLQTGLPHTMTGFVTEKIT
ncbi:MAG: hypothetical protein KGH98_00985 [Candidatus Micrarchaeota archaeon]|nr:hypothetical protein [Candidatus Micrarchaeota archaeon]